MEGWRKVILAGAFGAAIVAFPLDPVQAKLMETLIYATMGANAVEHLAKRLANGKAGNNDRSTNGTRVLSVRDIGNPVDPAPPAKSSNDH